MVICGSVALISPEARALVLWYGAKRWRMGMKTTYHIPITLLRVCTICKCAVLEKAISNILQPAGLLTHYLHNIIAKAQFSELERNSEIKIPGGAEWVPIYRCLVLCQVNRISYVQKYLWECVNYVKGMHLVLKSTRGGVWVDYFSTQKFLFAVYRISWDAVFIKLIHEIFHYDMTFLIISKKNITSSLREEGTSQLILLR